MYGGNSSYRQECMNLPVVGGVHNRVQSLNPQPLLNPMRRTIICLFLLFTLFGNSVLAGNALADVCCLAGDDPSTYDFVDGSDTNTDPCESGAAHCCHASVHFTALAMPGSGTSASPPHSIWPLAAVRQIAFLPHTPPVPPPNA